MTGKRKYQVNEEFFDKFSDDMAYVLGFIAADGYVYLGSRNSGMLSIGLSKKDESHLKKIRSLLGSEHPIREKITNFDTKAVRLDIGSLKIATQLTNLGIMQNKSNNLRWPNIPYEFSSHFARGYFDGDGYIRLVKTEYLVNLELSILGTFDLLSGLSSEFGNLGSLRQSQSQYRLTYGGSDSPVAFAEWIYKNSVAQNRMTRKYSVYQNYLTSYYKRNHYGSEKWKNNVRDGNYRVTYHEEVIKMTNRYLEVNNYAQVSREFGLGYWTTRYNIKQELKKRNL